MEMGFTNIAMLGFGIGVSVYETDAVNTSATHSTSTQGLVIFTITF
jgi:hypothetical protein